MSKTYMTGHSEKILFLVILFAAACASPGHKALVDYLDKGIGVTTYEQVVKRWGSPEKMTEKNDYFIAEWVDEDYYLIETPGKKGAFVAPTLTGRKVTLKFDKATKLLRKYDIVYY